MINKPIFFFFIFNILVSLNLNGQQTLKWATCYGGTNSEVAHSILALGNEKMIIAGQTFSADMDVTGHYGSTSLQDLWVAQIDTTGNIIWSKNYGGIYSDVAHKIIKTMDNCFVIVGYTSSFDYDVTDNNGGNDVWVIKIDSIGNLLWEETYGSSLNEQGEDIIQLADSGFVIAAWSNGSDGDVGINYGGQDYWVIRIDKNGSLLWENSFGGTSPDVAYSLLETADGGLLIGGHSRSTDGDVSVNYGGFDAWLVKTDGSGNLQWEGGFGGSLNDKFYRLVKTSMGEYLFAATSESSDIDVGDNNGYTDTWFVCLDSNFVIKWENNFGGPGNEYYSSVKENPNGNYVAATWSNSPIGGDITDSTSIYYIWFIEFDTSGTILWQYYVDGSGEEYFHSFDLSPSGNIMATGVTDSNDGDISGFHGGDYDIFCMYFENLQTTINEKTETDQFVIYPNPFSSVIKINKIERESTIEVFNVLGEKVISVQSQNTSVDINLSELENGIYFIKISSEKGVMSKKIVKE